MGVHCHYACAERTKADANDTKSKAKYKKGEFEHVKTNDSAVAESPTSDSVIEARILSVGSETYFTSYSSLLTTRRAL